MPTSRPSAFAHADTHRTPLRAAAQVARKLSPSSSLSLTNPRLLRFTPRVVSIAMVEPAQEELHRQRHASREAARELQDLHKELSDATVALQAERERNQDLLTEVDQGVSPCAAAAAAVRAAAEGGALLPPPSFPQPPARTPRAPSPASFLARWRMPAKRRWWTAKRCRSSSPSLRCSPMAPPRPPPPTAPTPPGPTTALRRRAASQRL